MLGSSQFMVLKVCSTNLASIWTSQLSLFFLMMCIEAHINTFCFCPQNKNPLFLLIVDSLHTELKAGWAVSPHPPSSSRDAAFEEKLCYLGIRTCMWAKPGLLSWDIFTSSQHERDRRRARREQQACTSNKDPKQAQGVFRQVFLGKKQPYESGSDV